MKGRKMLKQSLAIGAAALAIVAAAAFPAAPALAQNTKVSEIIVYGTDPCPRTTDDEIVVCARKPESERFRIPEALRQGGSLQSRQAWAARAKQFETVGRTGTNSCSPVGPSGWTGCTEQVISQAFNEREEQVQSDSAPRP
jgi:hypothetical protein